MQRQGGEGRQDLGREWKQGGKREVRGKKRPRGCGMGGESSVWGGERLRGGGMGGESSVWGGERPRGRYIDGC